MATRKILADLDFGNASAIINLPDAVAAQSPVTLAQLNSVLEKLDWKDDVRVASTANINLSSPGASIDSVAMSNGDRFLAKDQTTDSQNGIYIWNGASSAATRAPDADTAESLNTAVVNVQEGTANENTTWRQTQLIATINTDTVAWTPFGTSVPDASTSTKGKIAIATQVEVDAGAVTDKAVTPETLTNFAGLLHKHAETVGDNSSTSITVTHNFGTEDVIVQVHNAGGNQDEVLCEVRKNDVDSVDLLFDVAPTTNQLRVVVIG